MLGLREVYRNECGVLMSAANAGLFLFVLGKLIHLQSVGNSGCSKMLIDHISFAVATLMTSTRD